MTLVVVSATERVEVGASAFLIGSAAACDMRIALAAPAHVRIEGGVIEAAAPCRIGKVPLAEGERRLVVVGCAIEIEGEELWLEEKEKTGVTTRELALEAASASANPVIVVAQGEHMGAERELLPGQRCTIGRTAACDLDLGTDDAVSRLHLEVARDGEAVLVRDLGSVGGSFLGRARMEAQRAIVWTPERMIRVGKTVLALRVPWWVLPASPNAAPNVVDASASSATSALESDEAPAPVQGASTSAAAIAVVPASEPAAAPRRRPAQPPPRSIAGLALVGAVVLLIGLGLAILAWLISI